MRAFLVFIIFISHTAFAELDWRESSIWNSAQVLAQGQHHWSARVGQKNIRNRYGTSGSVEALGKIYDQNWKWQDILSAEKDLESFQALNDYMVQNDILPDDVAATSTMEVERNEVLLDLSWAYGVTEKWTFGFFVPISHVSTHANLKVEAHSATVAAVQSTKPQGMSPKEAESTVENLIHQQIQSQGFRSLTETKERWVWGDISLLNQYLVYENPDQKFSLQQLVRVPTSRNPSLGDYVQAQRDDGQIDLGISAYYDYAINAAVVTAATGYISQLSAPVRMNRQGQGDHRLADQEIERDLGDIWWAGAEVNYNLTSRLNLGGGYRFFTKGQDEYAKDSQIANAPGQQVQIVRLMSSYILSYEEPRYDIKRNWAVNMEVQGTIAGRNSEDALAATLELQTHF